MNIVTISLKPYHEKFLRHQFESPKGDIQISRTHEMGKFISAQVDYSTKPVKHENYENPVKLVIPEVHGIKNEGFAFVSATSAIKISDYIESYFMLYFREFIFTCRSFNIQFKDAINMFIDVHDIGHDLINYDRLKKNDYRFRLRVQDFIRDGIKGAYNQSIKNFSYNLSFSGDN